MRAVFLHFQPRFIDYRVAPFQKRALTAGNTYTQYIIPPIAVVHVDAFLCGPQAVFVASHANYDPAHLAINERVPLSFEFNTTARALTTTTLPAVIIIFFRQNHAAR